MSADDNRRMVPRLLALLVWALVAASAVFWGLRLFARAAPSPAVATSELTAAAQGDLSRLLGAAVLPDDPEAIEAPAPAVSARFRLTGVMAPRRPSDQGLAVISVDGNPPRVYRVGAAIDGDLMLREVSLRTATVASAHHASDPAGTFVLELPLVAAAATGVLPPTLAVPDAGVPPGLPPRALILR